MKEVNEFREAFEEMYPGIMMSVLYANGRYRVQWMGHDNTFDNLDDALHFVKVMKAADGVMETHADVFKRLAEEGD